MTRDKNGFELDESVRSDENPFHEKPEGGPLSFEGKDADTPKAAGEQKRERKPAQ